MTAPFSGNVTGDMVAPPPTPRGFAVDVARVSASFQDLARQMGQQFLDKQEIIRLMTVSAIAGEHMVIVGPPGTAKSAMIDMFSKLIDARYFEYLLTRFTEPNELFGPVDISARVATRAASTTCCRRPRSCSSTRSSSRTPRS
jgi:MoxR-like ATPase